jgi:DivIVA domain-containing protein
VVVVEVVVVALVLFAVVALATGRGGSMADFPRDEVPRNLPDDRPVFRADIDRLRFDLGLRGYRMDQVDEVLDRLANEIEARDARIAELTGAIHDQAEQWPSSS